MSHATNGGQQPPGPNGSDDRVAKILDFAAARGNLPSVDWMTKLAKNKYDGTLPTIKNAMLILANDPVLKGMLGYNEFSGRHFIYRPPPPLEDGAPLLPGPYPRDRRDEDTTMILAYIQGVHCPKMTKSTIEDAMTAEALTRRTHPVKDWLKSLVWDGVQRIDYWLSDAFDCDSNPYHSAIGAKFLVAAVRRIMEPGVQFDHMVVLEGFQGIGKSRTCRALFGDDWFSDDLPHDLKNKDARFGLVGVWCFEFSEIEHLIRNEVETIKAFLSCRTDRYRPPWGRNFIAWPRQVVLIGTTNAADYLKDTTGGRRFWPVKCQGAHHDWVLENREQLWAEAVAREKQKELIWLEDQDIQEEAEKAQAERLAEDAWDDKVADHLLGRFSATTADVLLHCLGIPAERQGRRETIRLAGIMRRLGWEQDHIWEHDEIRGSKKTKRVWVRAELKMRKDSRQAGLPL